MKSYCLYFYVVVLNGALIVAPQNLHADEAKEDISLARIMRVFGVALIAADRLALSPAAASDISRVEIETAIQGIDQALAAADQALGSSCVGALLPSRIKSLTESEQADYSLKFRRYMEQFRLRLVTYRELFVELQEQPPEMRNLPALAKVSRELRSIANDSHDNL